MRFRKVPNPICICYPTSFSAVRLIPQTFGRISKERIITLMELFWMVMTASSKYSFLHLIFHCWRNGTEGYSVGHPVDSDNSTRVCSIYIYILAVVGHSHTISMPFTAFKKANIVKRQSSNTYFRVVVCLLAVRF